MIDLLSRLLEGFVCFVQTGATLVVNAVIAALGAFVGLLVAAMPVAMPDLPALPSQFATAAGWVAWFFPVATVVQILAFFLTAWLAWQAVAIGLRWAKAL